MYTKGQKLSEQKQHSPHHGFIINEYTYRKSLSEIHLALP